MLKNDKRIKKTNIYSIGFACAVILSLSALVIAILALFSKCGCLSVENGVLSLVGVCTTLIVGINIVDALKIKQMEVKVKEMEQVRNDLEVLRINANIAIHTSLGLSYFNSQQYVKAFEEYQKSYKHAFENNDAKRVRMCTKLMKETIECVNKLNQEERAEIKHKLERYLEQQKNKCSSDERYIDEVLGFVQNIGTYNK